MIQNEPVPARFRQTDLVVHRELYRIRREMGRLASILRRQGKVGQIEPVYREAIRLRPALWQPHAELAWLLANRPEQELRHPQQAVEAARRAVRVA